MNKTILESIESSEFLNLADERDAKSVIGNDSRDYISGTSGCIGLPPGCDCICNQPCDFTTPGCYRL